MAAGPVQNLPYASAGNCQNAAAQFGDINLDGLPFSIDPTVTVVTVGAGYSSGTFSVDRKQVTLSGGGDCGGAGLNGPLLLKQD